MLDNWVKLRILVSQILDIKVSFIVSCMEHGSSISQGMWEWGGQASHRRDCPFEWLKMQIQRQLIARFV